jgi:hypothetical protein
VRRVIAVLVLAFVAVFGVSLPNQPKAEASVCNAAGCGVVKNVGNLSIRVFCNYGDSSGPLVFPGETSTKYCPDVDQYEIPSGYKMVDSTGQHLVTFIGPQRVKILSLPWTKRLALSRR